MTPFKSAHVFALSIALALTASCSADKSTPASGVASSGSSASAASGNIVGLETERKQVSYMVGLDLAKNLAPIKGEVDIDTVLQAIRSAQAGDKPLLSEAQASVIRQHFVEHLRLKRETEQKALAAKNLQEGEVFLAQNAKQAGIVTTPSGLQYQVLRDAGGDKPKPTDTVRVNYIGSFLSGAEFDNTYKTDHTASLVLNQVVPGIAEGLALMPAGSKYKFWIPAKLAYGEHGVTNAIEPNAALIYEVELVEIAGMPSHEPEKPGTRD
ncbi:FKBP-type peptidyl-prolyl cis-trans isomerase N-terminal domain-containing protein [Dyella silvatica]|uniref:FKBP-type peptidyl-prolyl cis-trans isomerase N-terminal domain-containing protein n=1 Tax=Dyella silvatica TaxID=2992128 RepID=UPI00224F9EC5|nr:FKBP-type peptidyl-prolyl cis-trans isomerase [Dyella silvatica]